jgi:hypothetical protein
MSTGDYIFPVGIPAHHRTLPVASRSSPTSANVNRRCQRGFYVVA